MDEGNRVWYGWVFTALGVYLLFKGVRVEGTAATLLLVASPATFAAGLGLLRRKPWSRLLSCALVATALAFGVARGLALGHGWADVSLWSWLALAVGLWSLRDLWTLDLTLDDELRTLRGRLHTMKEEARLGRLRMLHLRDQAEAELLDKLPGFEAWARERHTLAGHESMWEHCDEAECQEARTQWEKGRKFLGIEDDELSF